MSLKGFMDRQNRIHLKILAAFIGLVFLFATSEIVVSSMRTSAEVEARTVELLKNHVRLLNEIIRERENDVAFYAQFMADVTRLSEQLSNTSAGRSVLIYLLDSLKKEHISVHLLRTSEIAERTWLVKRGLLGIRVTGLQTVQIHGKPTLALAAVAPIERGDEISEVIVAEFLLDERFVAEIKTKIGADVSLIFGSKMWASTLAPTSNGAHLLENVDDTLREVILKEGGLIFRDIGSTDNPQKGAFAPISINFKHQGIFVVSKSMRQVLTGMQAIVLQNSVLTGIVMLGVAVLYYLIVRRITRPILELSTASRQVAKGNLQVAIPIMSTDELGQLAGSFNTMVEQLRNSHDRVDAQVNELSRLYREVADERNITRSILDNLSNGVVLFGPDQRVALLNPMARQWLGLEDEFLDEKKTSEVGDNPALDALHTLGKLQHFQAVLGCWIQPECEVDQPTALQSGPPPRSWGFSQKQTHENAHKRFPKDSEACSDCDVYLAYCAAIKEQSMVRSHELVLEKPSYRQLTIVHSPIFDGDDKFLGWINVLTDVTREREVDRMKSEFVSLVSHEFRTPLSSIKAFAEILMSESEPDGDRQRKFVEIINEETERLAGLIDDILNVERIEEGRLLVSRREVKICELIKASVSAQKTYARIKHIQMKVEVPDDSLRVMADEGTLKQVLNNLLNNAIKYTRKDGQIQVRAYTRLQQDSSEAVVEVRVEDTGIGLPPEQLEKIFQRFYRVEQVISDRQPGTGLGLYFCRYIIEKHDGKIWAESDGKSGSSFVFYLPEAPLEGREETHEPVPEVPVMRSWKEPGDVPILVVDDEKNIRDFLNYYLTSEGFVVHEASDGKEGLRQAQEVRPALVLLDAVLPEMDGYEVLEALKRDPTLKDVPVILVSASETPTLALRLGAASTLLKPVSRERLLEAVYGALAHSYAPPEIQGHPSQHDT